jgi:hypothetical protein
MTVVDGKWSALLGYQADPQTHEISAELQHLSPYGLVESAEGCTNGIDDDGDGLIDCADPICATQSQCLAGPDAGDMPDSGRTQPVSAA